MNGSAHTLTHARTHCLPRSLRYFDLLLPTFLMIYSSMLIVAGWLLDRDVGASADQCCCFDCSCVDRTSMRKKKKPQKYTALSGRHVWEVLLLIPSYVQRWIQSVGVVSHYRHTSEMKFQQHRDRSSSHPHLTKNKIRRVKTSSEFCLSSSLSVTKSSPSPPCPTLLTCLCRM